MSDAAIATIIAAMISGVVSIYITRPRNAAVAPAPVPAPAPAIVEPSRLADQPSMDMLSSGDATITPPPTTTLPNGQAAMIDSQNQAVVVKKRSVAFVIGLIGLVAWFLPIIGAPLAIYGLTLALRHQKTPHLYTHVDPAVWLNVVALVLAVVNAVLGAAMA